jgi:hypothetical protein
VRLIIWILFIMGGSFVVGGVLMGIGGEEQGGRGSQLTSGPRHTSEPKRKEEAPPGSLAEEPAPETAAREEAAVVFRVGGAAGQQFVGAVGNAGSTRIVEGTTSQDFRVQKLDTGPLSADVVSANAQKMEPGYSKRFTCQVIVDGEVVKQSSTKAEYGVCQVVWSRRNSSARPRSKCPN